MKTHVALFTAVTAGAMAIASVATRADDDGGGKVVISTTEAPAAIGPYSQAIRVGRTVYVAGEIGKKPSGEFAGTSIEDQTGQALKNVAAILAAAGLTLDNVVSTTVYLLDVKDFAGMNTAYKAAFVAASTSSFPARATVQVAALPTPGALVEISAIAVDTE